MFHNLYLSQSPQCYNIICHRVINKSNRVLSIEEVLSLGPEFVPSLGLRPIEVRCDSEIRLSQLPANKFKAIMMYDVQTRRALTYKRNNICPKQRIILNTLRLDDNISMCKADKGRSLVIFNSKDYITTGSSN
ncbi:hypothetical protein GJ496_001476 [Pomphorhynchus laevis]|nr:hypothetical protein GJ496_001476 [Pomphorhynchus laevis]